MLKSLQKTRCFLSLEKCKGTDLHAFWWVLSKFIWIDILCIIENNFSVVRNLLLLCLLLLNKYTLQHFNKIANHLRKIWIWSWLSMELVIYISQLWYILIVKFCRIIQHSSSTKRKGAPSWYKWTCSKFIWKNQLR